MTRNPEVVRPVPATEQQKRLLRDREPFALALQAFDELDTLKPIPIPPALRFSDPSALEQWKRAQAQIPEHLAGEFLDWLERKNERCAAMHENARRLRTTAWAETMLRGTEHDDYAQTIAAFHREVWRIGHIPADSAKREQLVLDAVKQRGL
jgi:hypothetical protein